MKLLCAIMLVTVFTSLQVHSKTKDSELTKIRKKVLLERDSFYDPNFDYSMFIGRITDRNDSNNIFKITSENRNIRFLRAGDALLFGMEKDDKQRCEGFVRSAEADYVVIYSGNLDPCINTVKTGFIRRGSLLKFRSVQLAKRVKDASLYRIVLLKRRDDFFKQLNGLNNFLWAYDQERVKLASEYDQQILDLEKNKQKALDILRTKKKDGIKLQKELMWRIDQLDADLKYYRIGRDDLLVDRWNKDHDLGHPVGKRPVKMKPLDE